MNYWTKKYLASKVGSRDHKASANVISSYKILYIQSLLLYLTQNCDCYLCIKCHISSITNSHQIKHRWNKFKKILINITRCFFFRKLYTIINNYAVELWQMQDVEKFSRTSCTAKMTYKTLENNLFGWTHPVDVYAILNCDISMCVELLFITFRWIFC